MIDTNLLLTEHEGRTKEYWPKVVTVWTEHREVYTKSTEGQYSPVRLKQARLVSSLLYGTQAAHAISHFWSVKFKGLPARDDVSNSERTSYHGFHFWIRSQSVGITFTMQLFQVQLDWSRRNLSFPIEPFFGFAFVNQLSDFHLFCVLVHDLRFALQY